MGFVKVIDESLKQIPDFIDFVSGTDESLKRVMRCVSVSSIVFDEMLLSSLAVRSYDAETWVSSLASASFDAGGSCGMVGEYNK